MNPFATHENELILSQVSPSAALRIAVVDAGPAGLAAATSAASRGHKVTLFERDEDIGGQFNMAKMIPGKEEFHETIRYFRKQITLTGVQLELKTNVVVKDLIGFDAVVLATGVTPRDIKLPVKTCKVRVVNYIDVLKGGVAVGNRVAIVGAGGIGYDIGEFITHNEASSPLPKELKDDKIKAFLNDWGVDQDIALPGGLAAPSKSNYTAKNVFLLQRKAGKLGATLGKTTGWIHKAALKKKNVQELGGCKYLEVNDNGLVVERNGQLEVLPVDTVIICAGQVPQRELYDELVELRKRVFLIGGSQEASELDAKRAIDQGTRLAAVIESAKTGDVFNADVEIAHP